MFKHSHIIFQGLLNRQSWADRLNWSALNVADMMIYSGDIINILADLLLLADLVIYTAELAKLIYR